MIRSHRSILFTVVAFSLVFVSQLVNAASYSVVDLGAFQTRGVNNHGQVVGLGGFLWSGGMLINIKPFIAPVEPSTGNAYDINDAERILVGEFYGIAGPCSSTSGGHEQMSVVQDGRLICGSLVDAQEAGGLNATGQVALTRSAAGYAYVWDSNTGVATKLVNDFLIFYNLILRSTSMI